MARHPSKIKKLTLKERRKRAARNERRDRAGALTERRAAESGIIVARDLKSLRRKT